MDKYVCGFLMDYDMERFLLIDKKGLQTPHGPTMYWQGIGGKIKKDIPATGYMQVKETPTDVLVSLDIVRDERPTEAMVREFYEETDYIVSLKRWHCFHIKTYKATKIYFFVAFGSLMELRKVVEAWSGLANVEGNVSPHSLIDVYFDGRQYTFDIPYLIAMIIREQKAGMLMQLDPEGVNTLAKSN